MSDDILREAARALRQETAEAEPTTRFTRGRVMASLHRGQRRRRSRIVWLLPIAAVLAGTTAFASGGGRAAWQSVAAAIGIGEAPPPVVTAKLERAPLRRAASRVVTPQRQEASALADSEPSAAVETPKSTGPRPAPQRSAALAEVAEPPESDPTLPLYREAHRQHFTAGNPSAALAAWDRYLARAPGGRFSVEARYNRAICLVRLGRRDEARRALEPFASGSFGAYRQTSARALLDSLGGNAPED
jgi:hypothetical protein